MIIYIIIYIYNIIIILIICKRYIMYTMQLTILSVIRYSNLIGYTRFTYYVIIIINILMCVCACVRVVRVVINDPCHVILLCYCNTVTL